MKEARGDYLARKKAKSVLGKDEVMEFFSAIVRGEEITSESGESELPNMTMRFKAAELMGKCYGMFSEKTGGADGKLPVIIMGEENIEI